MRQPHTPLLSLLRARTHTHSHTHTSPHAPIFKHGRLDHCHCHHHRRPLPPPPPAACSKLNVPASSLANDRHVAGESSHLPIFRRRCRGLSSCSRAQMRVIRSDLYPPTHTATLSFIRYISALCRMHYYPWSMQSFCSSHAKLPGAQACPSSSLFLPPPRLETDAKGSGPATMSHFNLYFRRRLKTQS